MPFQRLAVFANGDVSACCSIFFSKKLIIGNLYKMSLKEIWDSEEIQSIRRGLIKEDPVAICKECLGSVSSSL
jgi:radical SAM protein with 4Fe4S-binding SPASM domain